MREWGEEHADDDIIYAIYLRRVLYQPQNNQPGATNSGPGGDFAYNPKNPVSNQPFNQQFNTSYNSQTTQGSGGTNSSGSTQFSNQSSGSGGSGNSGKPQRLLSEHHSPEYTDTVQDGKLWVTEKIRLVKSASLDQLVDHLAVCMMNKDDVNFFEVFMNTYWKA